MFKKCVLFKLQYANLQIVSFVRLSFVRPRAKFDLTWQPVCGTKQILERIMYFVCSLSLFNRDQE